MRKNNRIAGFAWMIYVFLVFGFYGCKSGDDTEVQRTIGNKGVQTIPEPFHIEANDTLGIRLGMSLAEYLKRYPDSFRERPNPRNPDVPIGPDCEKEAAGRVLCTVVTASTDSFSVDGYKVEIYYLEFAGDKLVNVEYSVSGDNFGKLTNSFESKFGKCEPNAMPLNQSRCIWRNGSSTIELWSIPDKHAASITVELVDPATAMREKQEIQKNKWKAVYDDLDEFEKRQRSKLDGNERCQKIGYYAEIHGLFEDDCADIKGKECVDQCRKGFGTSALFRNMSEVENRKIDVGTAGTLKNQLTVDSCRREGNHVICEVHAGALTGYYVLRGYRITGKSSRYDPSVNRIVSLPGTVVNAPDVYPRSHAEIEIIIPAEAEAVSLVYD